MTSTIGQPSRSTDRGWVTSRPASSASSVGHGEASTQGTPARRARSTTTSRACQAGVCSCLWASSCSSSTSTAARSTHGGPGRRSGPDHRRPTPGLGPFVGHHGHGHARPAQAHPERLRVPPPTAGGPARCPAGRPARTSGNRSAPGASRSTVGRHTPFGGERGLGQLVAGGGDRVAGRPGVGDAGHRPGRRRRAQEGDGAAGPAVGGPVGEIDQVRGRAPPRDLGQRLQDRAVRGRSSRDRRPNRPPGGPAA